MALLIEDTAYQNTGVKALYRGLAVEFYAKMVPKAIIFQEIEAQRR